MNLIILSFCECEDLFLATVRSENIPNTGPAIGWLKCSVFYAYNLMVMTDHGGSGGTPFSFLALPSRL